MTAATAFLTIAAFCLVVGFAHKRWGDRISGLFYRDWRSWPQWLRRDGLEAIFALIGDLFIGAAVFFGVMAALAALVVVLV